MNQKIEIRASRKEIDSPQHDITAMANTITRMKAAGIPVSGIIAIRGVTHGELTMKVDGSDYVYSWRGSVPDEDDGALL